VDVRFTYDVNGALQMEATVNSTGKVASKAFAGHSSLSEKELAKNFERLNAIKLHPRDQMENRAMVERAERIYEERRGEDREFLLSAIAEFEASVSDQKLRDQGKIRQEFSNLLDSLERSPLGTN
jgi:molecular chaperone HscC